jgi:hypothetical protein
MTQGIGRPGSPSIDQRRGSLPPSGRTSAEHVRALDAATKLDVRLLKKFAQRPLMSVWKGEDAENRPVLLTVVDACGTPAERDRVVNAAQALVPLSGTEGIMNVYRVVDEADSFVSDFLGAGTAADLVVLQWNLAKKLDFVCRVADAMSELHESGLVHGCLCPDNILLDDDLKPVLTEIGMVSVRGSLDGDTENFFGYGAYAAPETASREPDVSADIFAIGQLLTFVVLDRAPDLPSAGEGESAIQPALSELRAKNPSVATIAQKCTSSPEARYASMKDFAADLRRCKQLLVPESTQVVRSADPRTAGASPARPTSAPKAAAKPAAPRERAEPPYVPARPGIDKPEAKIAAPLWVPFLSVLALGGALAVSANHPVRNEILHFSLQAVVAIAAVGLTAGLRVTSGLHAAAGIVAFLLAILANPTDRLSRIDASDDAGDRARQYILGGGRDLRRQHLVGANLSGLDMQGVNLENTILTGTHFARSNLTGARVKGASFLGTDLAGAKLTQVDLSGVVAVDTATCDDTTTFPDGWYCGPSGTIKAGSRPK